MNDTAKELLKKTVEKIEGAYAPATIRAYKSNFENFIKYCDEIEQGALPADPETVVTFIRKISNGHLKSASIRMAAASIASIHKLNRFNDPVNDPDVKLEMRRMHRKLGRESKQAYGINKKTLEKMIKQTTIDLRGLRDCALLYVAYDTMCRRDELTSLMVEDLVSINGIFKIKLRKSKTDQEKIGRWLNLSNESKNAIDKWLSKAKIKNGKLFRGVKNNQNLNSELNKAQVNKIFKKYAVKINIEHKNVSGHSIRVGSAQDLLKSGASIATILQKGRWSKTDTLMQYTKHLSID